MTTHPISRFPIPKLGDLPDDIAKRIRTVQEKIGFIPDVFLVLSLRPTSFAPSWHIMMH